MIRDQIINSLATALTETGEQLNGAAATPETLSLFKVERPKNPDHGDFAVNVSPLAKVTKLPPPKIAETLANVLTNGRYAMTVIGGFLNFKLSNPEFLAMLATLIQNPTPGKNNSMGGQKILLEYVSANPTGPLHIGHGRWAALGDSLTRLWRHCGAQVTPEFYINDAGVQMGNITQSVYLRALELLKTQFPQNQDLVDLSDLGEPPYPGEYVIDTAKKVLENPGYSKKILEARQIQLCAQNVDLSWLTAWIIDELLGQQKALLTHLGVQFDQFCSEKQALHDKQLPKQALEKLKAAGYTYEQDGAVWFKSSAFGDEKDRVLQKSDGSFTYLTPDIAYHDEKFCRQDAQGQKLFNRIVNIWGADHHGYIPRMNAAIQALGHPVEQFEVILGQLVNLIIEGEKTRMGKRRKMLTLQDVVDEVGVDATRLWMVWKPAETALDFDVALATSTSNDNPVFYIQYAHARCASILRNATEPVLNTETGTQQPARIAPDALQQFEAALTPEQLSPILDSLKDDPNALATVKTLLLKLDGFEDIIKDAGRIHAPHMIARYAVDLSADFHSFYNVCRVLTDDKPLTLARLMLVKAVQKTLATALNLLGVSAPDKM